jgi:diphthamide biosynthesis methyltransferase
MGLYVIGLGLGDERDITVRGLELIKQCTAVYLEYYTSVLGVDLKRLVLLDSPLFALFWSRRHSMVSQSS